MNLSDHLASLGVPAPSVPAPPPPPAGADAVLAACEPLWHASIRNHTTFDVFEMLDTYRALRMWSGRLEAELARYGSQVTHEQKAPRVPRLATTTHVDRNGEVTTSKQTILVPCEHHVVAVNGELAEIECRSCGEKINAVWWLARHAEAVSRAENWRGAMIDDKATISKEVQEAKDELKKTRDTLRRTREQAMKEDLRRAGMAGEPPRKPRKKRRA